MHEKLPLEGHAHPVSRRRRMAILGSTALIGGCLLLAAALAPQVACEISGAGDGAPAGSAAALDTGDQVVCPGEGLTDPVVAEEDSAEVAVTIGDGTTPTVLCTEGDASTPGRFSWTKVAHDEGTLATESGKPQRAMAQACARMEQIVHTACSLKEYNRNRKEGIQRCMAYELKYTMWSVYNCQ